MMGDYGDLMTEPKWYDITAPQKYYTRPDICERLEKVSDKFVVGKETGSKTGFEHWQIRVCFNIGKEMKAVYNIFRLESGEAPIHVSVTQSTTRNFDYCEKEGDFYRSWEKALNPYLDAKLKYWQGQAIASMLDEDDRTVVCIVDPDGGKGKTFMAKYCVANHIATYCPPLQDAQDFVAFAKAKPSKAYIFDMPKSESIKQRKGMWSAVEQIKNGYLYDKRYQFRDMWIEPPKIMVISNEAPDPESLSMDRWRVYKIVDTFGEDTLEEVFL